MDHVSVTFPENGSVRVDAGPPSADGSPTERDLVADLWALAIVGAIAISVEPDGEIWVAACR